MASVYHLSFDITDLHADCFGRLKPSSILYFVQEAAGKHWQHIEGETQQACSLYWVIIRHRVQISRLPCLGETIRLETWPMPTTRVAYPRSVVAYDSQGLELFRAISLWVLVDRTTRAMVLPGKSGLDFTGSLQGGELAVPGSILPKVYSNCCSRTVRFSDLDRNGHMNNTRYLEWLYDVLPSDFHKDHPIRDLTICYLAEARENQVLEMNWEIGADNLFTMESRRREADGQEHRVFAAKVTFD